MSRWKHDVKWKHDVATLEEEGFENNSLYTEKVFTTPKQETVNTTTSVASRSQLSTSNRTMQDHYMARKSEPTDNLNITQNSVQTDIRGKTKRVQEYKFQPPKTAKSGKQNSDETEIGKKEAT